MHRRNKCRLVSTAPVALVLIGVFVLAFIFPKVQSSVPSMLDTIPSIDISSIDYASILTQTLQTPVGLQGFESNQANDPEATAAIAVQFRTPPEVALRLLSKVHDIGLCSYTNQTYRQQALSAHDAFWAQIVSHNIVSSTSQIEILSEHYKLFNGIYAQIPVYMLGQIAALPEVYGVFPHVTCELFSYASEFFASPSEPTPLMQSTQELFNTDYIHNEMGISGAGVRVAIVSRGVDATHPILAPFANPQTGLIRGFNITSNSHDTSPLPHYTHGTQTAGPIVAISPGVELFVYVAQSTNDIITAIEMAVRDEIDILNISHGVGGPFGLDPATYAKNLAVLSGMIVVQSAGNNGARGNFSIGGRGDAGLTILVGNAETGCDNDSPRDRLSDTSSRGPSPQSLLICPDIVAPGTRVRTTNNPNSHTGLLYAYPTGTSISAPVITAVAALLVEAFPDATPQEIKAKMMNTAKPLTESIHSVFDVGAGHVDPIRALQTCTVVTVLHAIPWSYNERTLKRVETMSSLSFGRADCLTKEHESTYTMPLQIKNIETTPRSYTVSHTFTRNPGNFAELQFSNNSITVLPGETGTVYVTMSLSGYSANLAFDEHTYEGHVYVHNGDNLVARLPFAGDMFRTDETQTIEVSGPVLSSHDGRMQEFQAKITNFPPGRALELLVPHNQTGIALSPTVTRHTNIMRFSIRTYENDIFGENLLAIRIGDVESEPFVFMVGSTGPVHNHRELETAIALAPSDGTQHIIEIGSDFQMEHTIGIRHGRNIVFTSVDGEPRRTIIAPETGRHFISPSTITLRDIVLDGGGDNTYRGGIEKTWGGNLTMEAGSIIQGAHATNGGGVAVRSPAVFTMNGGEISNNTATSGGGGVFLTGPDAIFTATGGTISNNRATYGGGIWTPLEGHTDPVSEEAYLNVNIGMDVRFYGNTASSGYRPPSNRLPHIQAASASISYCPLNNYDINYRGTYLYVPITEASGQQIYVIGFVAVLLVLVLLYFLRHKDTRGRQTVAK